MAVLRDDATLPVSIRRLVWIPPRLAQQSGVESKIPLADGPSPRAQRNRLATRFRRGDGRLGAGHDIPAPRASSVRETPGIPHGLYSTRSFLTLTRSVSEASQPISSLTLRVSISPRCNVSVWTAWSIVIKCDLLLSPPSHKWRAVPNMQIASTHALWARKMLSSDDDSIPCRIEPVPR